MDQMFPIGFPAPLAFYLVVYLLMVVAHVFLMAYVLAGSLWLASVTLFPGTDSVPRTKQPLSRLLRDWMPFALSGAITAGVAPLLFVQILYRQQFYTSNLLLGWRWMVVIPVLVVAFYLLYIVKSRTISRLPFVVRLSLSVGVAFCFLFVAFCWTANHLLGLDAAQWPDAYESGMAVRSRPTLLLRLSTWVAGTFPTMSILAGWQLLGMRARTAVWNSVNPEPDWAALFQLEHRRLGIVSVGGLIVATCSAVGYWTTVESSVQTQLTGRIGFPWILITAGSILFQIVGWLFQLRRPCLCRRWLAAITAALLMTLIGTAVLREIVRLSQADLQQVTASAQAASAIGGFGVFLFFTLLNAGLITLCIWLVRSKHSS